MSRQSVFARFFADSNPDYTPLIRDPTFGLFLEEKIHAKLQELYGKYQSPFDMIAGIKFYFDVQSRASIHENALKKLKKEFEEWRKNEQA